MSGKVKMSRSYLALVVSLNNRLDHFPSHEQRALALVIRQKLYSLCDHMVEAQKRYHKSTHLNNLDIAHEQLRLRLSRSTIAHTRKGVNFVGYRTWRSKRFIRKHSLYKAKKAVRENRLDSFISHLAHASKTHSMQHLLNYAQEHNYDLYSRLPKKYHAGHYQDAQCSGWGDRAMYA